MEGRHRKHRTNVVAGGLKQKGIIHYGLAANRQNPFAGALHDAVFNTWRRTSGQLLFWVPPILLGYYAMDWAIHRCVVWPLARGQRGALGCNILMSCRNHYLYSKAGRAEFADSGEEE
jgi:ubiquinol-cytochrome c reductase subunit 8